jgi:hypothetical protein
MVLASGGQRLAILAAAGLRDCVSCHHTTMHFVVGGGEHPHSVDTPEFERTKLLVCDVCRHTSPLKDSEAAFCEANPQTT